VNGEPFAADSRCSGSRPKIQIICIEWRIFDPLRAPFSWGARGEWRTLLKQAASFYEGPERILDAASLLEGMLLRDTGRFGDRSASCPGNVFTGHIV
jgi:hypothetical protein